MSIFPNPSPVPPGSEPPAAPPPPPAAGAPPPFSQPPYYQAPAPPAPSGGSNLKTSILFGAVIALLAACVYLYFQLDGLKKEMVKSNDALASRLDKMEETSSVTTRSHRKTVEELRDQLERARRQAAIAAGAAKDEALKKVDETRAKLEAAQQQTEKELKSDISQVKESTESANTKISAVGSEVKTVKGDVAQQRADYEKTVADLKRATGEIDGHSVLIATNGKELAALRALGERNFVEFTVHKSKQAQKVGDVLVLLKKTDPKKNRYTIDLTADDKTTEKRDRGVNEPIQFMTSKAKQPYELVVNDVKKDTIAGYLSVPKVLNVRN